MAKKMINTERVEGRVYEHDLAIKKVQNQQSANFGKEFIAGNLSVATDEEGLNVIQVHFTYVTEATKSGARNNTYTVLKKIIDEGKAWITDGKESAMKVRIDTALALNDFYGRDDNLVSAKINEGGFINIVSELSPENERNTFTEDMLITKVTRVEADPENNIEADYVKVKGAVFNFRNAILPVEFIVRNSAGMDYFEDLNVSSTNPIFTKVWGRINSTTTVIERTEESAFGEAAVKTYERKTKEWTITGTQKFPYEYGEEGVLTDDEVKKAIQDREVYLAEVKKRADDYRNSHASVPTNGAAATVTKGGFDF